jgi:hypothetical protein
MDAIDCERTVSPITVSPIVEDIMESYNRTKSVKAIAREHGCSWKKVAKILSSNGIIVNERQAMILDLHGKGHSVKEIAQRVGCSESTVRMYLPAVIPGYRLPGYKFSVAGDKPITLDRSISPN